jgi:hypothetical protein
VDASSNNYGSATTFKLWADNTGGCVPTSTAYIKWDISAIASDPTPNKTIGSAVLAFTVNYASGAYPIVISLYKAGNDSWTEGDTNGTHHPGVIEPLLTAVTVNSAPTAGTVVVFPSTAELASYLNSVSVVNAPPGNGLASFAMRITSCGTGQARIDFRSLQHTTVLSRPNLELLNPNAVTLTTFHAATPAPNWPLIAAGLLVAALLAGVAVYRWRLSRVSAR